jgi:hypothetical protein
MNAQLPSREPSDTTAYRAGRSTAAPRHPQHHAHSVHRSVFQFLWITRSDDRRRAPFRLSTEIEKPTDERRSKIARLCCEVIRLGMPAVGKARLGPCAASRLLEFG